MLKNNRHYDVFVFLVSMAVSVVLYVVLLRTFGALPVVRSNAAHIDRLEAKVDSLRSEIRHVQP